MSREPPFHSQRSAPSFGPGEPPMTPRGMVSVRSLTRREGEGLTLHYLAGNLAPRIPSDLNGRIRRHPENKSNPATLSMSSEP